MTEPLFISRIWPAPTKNPAVTRFILIAKRGDRIFGETLQLHTVNAWLASLCDHAKEQQRPVLVTWQDTAYGLEAMHVAPIEEQVTHAANL